ncbi:MAG: NUDIX domain-containing protein [Roseovarius sp.]
MRQVTLVGPGWTGDLIHILAGDATSVEKSNVTLDGDAAARALYLARVAGLPCDSAGEASRVHVVNDVDPHLLAAAAREILGYFGRVPAEQLVPRRQMIMSRAEARLLADRLSAPTELRCRTNLEDVDVDDMSTPHEGFFLTRTYRLRHPQFEGGMSHALTREVFVATDAAIVLPYDPVRDRLLLVEQFRMGPFGRGDPFPWVLEPVAGRVDGGETPEETARRECLEEADLELDRLEHVSSHYCSPGCSTEVFHCYVGLCELPENGQSHGGLDTENEDLRRHVIAFEQALEMTRSGEVNVGPLFALLLWLERERPRLRASA